MIDPKNLPDDVASLKAMILASHDEITGKDALIERKEDHIQRLEKLVADFKRALFGARSEKVALEQYDLALEDIETAMASIHAEDDAENVSPTKADRKRKTNRGSLPKHLPRIEVVNEPEETICSCGTERHVIGEDVSERLDIIPAQFRVIVTRRPNMPVAHVRMVLFRHQHLPV